MHYLTDLANKLVATYDQPKDVSGGEGSIERRKHLVAALKRALELEVTPENLKEQSSNPFAEYNTAGAVFSANRLPKG